jgi:hypothetical protein
VHHAHLTVIQRALNAYLGTAGPVGAVYLSVGIGNAYRIVTTEYDVIVAEAETRILLALQFVAESPRTWQQFHHGIIIVTQFVAATQHADGQHRQQQQGNVSYLSFHVAKVVLSFHIPKKSRFFPIFSAEIFGRFKKK